MAKTKFCTNCGSANEEDDKFCGDCGSPLKESSGTDKSKEIGGYLVCESCGGSYKLQEGESPDDFASCQCGGKLIHTQDPSKIKSSDSKSRSVKDSKTESASKSAKKVKGKGKISKKKKIIIGLAGICLVAIVLFVAIGMPISSGKTFENQYVKFQVPEGVNVTDYSDSESLSIELKNESKIVGSIQFTGFGESTFIFDPDIKNITVAGKKAGETTVEVRDGIRIYLYIPTTDALPGAGAAGNLYKGFTFSFNDQAVYDVIKNSFVIKKTPP